MQLRFVICMPVFDHPKTVVEVIEKCLTATDFPLIVVDDGSEILVEELFSSSALLSQKNRITFIRHSKNFGKGKALQTGIQKAVSLAYTHMITIDADGQHLPEEIEKLIHGAEISPWAVILGDRQMQTQNVPSSSVFGKAFSNFWVKYETDTSVGDSQSGFRIYPLFYLQTMSFLTRRYDFEIEILTRLIWKGVEVKSVPITVVYFPPGKRVTHFNKFKDNLRLTVLNTILVSASLLRRDDSPLKSAIATAVGVFVGSWPVYGLHTIIVAALSFLFRMNFIYLWMGTHISTPPLLPLIIYCARHLSQWYVGHPPQGHFGLSSDWLIGLFLFSLIASFVSGVLVFVIKNSIRQAARKRKQKVSVKSTGGVGIFFMQAVLNLFGLKTAYFFLGFIVPYYYVFSFRARQSCNEYWKVSQPSLGYFSRQIRIIKQLFVFAQILVDRAYQRGSDQKAFTMVEGAGVSEFVRLMNNSKRGNVILQSHFGGWDIAMGYFRHLHFNKKMMAVMYGVEGSFDHSSMRKKDDQVQVTHFNLQEDTILKLKTFLDRGDVVGLMGDRPVGRSFEMVSFFGRLALFDTSAIRLAQMCAADLSFIFCAKQRARDYFVDTIVVESSLAELEGLSREEITVHLVKQYAALLEAHVTRYPEQWFNFFPFWSEKLT